MASSSENLSAWLEGRLNLRADAKANRPVETPEEFNARIEKQHREMPFRSYQWAGGMGTSHENRGRTLTAAGKSFADDVESIAIPSSN